jgi:hypothetical protein
LLASCYRRGSGIVSEAGLCEKFYAAPYNNAFGADAQDYTHDFSENNRKIRPGTPAQELMPCERIQTKNIPAIHDRIHAPGEQETLARAPVCGVSGRCRAVFCQMHSALPVSIRQEKLPDNL